MHKTMYVAELVNSYAKFVYCNYINIKYNYQNYVCK